MLLLTDIVTSQFFDPSFLHKIRPKQLSDKTSQRRTVLHQRNGLHTDINRASSSEKVATAYSLTCSKAVGIYMFKPDSRGPRTAFSLPFCTSVLVSNFVFLSTITSVRMSLSARLACRGEAACFCRLWYYFIGLLRFSLLGALGVSRRKIIPVSLGCIVLPLFAFFTLVLMTSLPCSAFFDASPVITFFYTFFSSS